MATKNITKKEMYNAMINALKEAGITELEVTEKGKFNPVDTLTHEIEMLDKKAAAPKKPSKDSLKDESYRADIIAYLTEVDKAVTIKEIQTGMGGEIATLSNQKMAKLLSPLVDEKAVKRTEVKRIAHFEIA